MAINYTYPLKENPVIADEFLVVDSTDNATKKVTIESVIALSAGGAGFLSLGGGAMTGAITTDSTFDGRDVSTDGAKLDGIESSADVTDSTNVASAGALMDSELTNITAVKAINQSLVSAASPNFAVGNMTVSNTNLKVVDTTNLQTFVDGVDESLLYARGTGVTISYVSSVVVGGALFSQGGIKGEINGDEGYFNIVGDAQANVAVTILSLPNTFVYYDKAGDLQQQNTEPTRQDFVRKIFTMRIAVNTSTEKIIGFEYLNNPVGHYSNSMRDIYSYLLAQKIPFKKGQNSTGRAADLGFDLDAGSLMEFGGTGDIFNPNIKNLDEVLKAEFFLSTRTSFDAGGNVILPKFWDNNGAITPLGSGTVVGHRLSRYSNGNVCLQYGQGNYANMTLAKAGARLEDYVPNPAIANATFFGWWFINETATNSANTSLVDFVEYKIGI
jgi:hypothetical protein